MAKKASSGFGDTADTMDKVGSYEGKGGENVPKFPFQKQVGLMATDTGPLASNDRPMDSVDRKDCNLP